MHYVKRPEKTSWHRCDNNTLMNVYRNRKRTWNTAHGFIVTMDQRPVAGRLYFMICPSAKEPSISKKVLATRNDEHLAIKELHMR